MMRIDSHHHFWRYDPIEYDWIDDDMRVLRRDFLPNDLRPLLKETGIDGVISVQARQTVDETRWLIELARDHDFVRGVVGWLPLAGGDVERELDQFSENRKLVAVRHVVQAERDDQFILRDDFNRGVAALERYQLRYDILIFERHLPQTTTFVDRHARQVFVLDHVAKPKIKAGEIEPWRTHIRELARRPNVYCKISGMVTEADSKTWTPEQLRPYFEVVLESFGSRRLMFGSDWPVCLVGASYALWHQTVADWTAELSPDERELIFGATAIEAYDLEARA